mmetsp:Transcript_9818/g.22979  ORF Transcript_9818/g.22979 Transcript_9818/m.22979 type:complete len:638 (-) Transcript_9818:861-2774(-)
MAAKDDAFHVRAKGSGEEEWTGDVWVRDEWTEEEKAKARSRLHASGKESRCYEQFRNDSSTNWNNFYHNNGTSFFKDRHYLHKAFPAELAWLYCESSNDFDTMSGREDCMSIVEIGCGVGNAVLPLIEQHAKLTWNSPPLIVHCLDFAPSAIDLLKNDTRFCEPHTAHVYDVSSMHPSTINLDCGRTSSTLAGSADVAILLFCLSAIGPHPSPPLARAAQHVIDMLKPGGVLLMRDYGMLDEAQLKLGKGAAIGNNFYRKGDGTGVFYFELDNLRDLFVNKHDQDGKLEELELDYIQRVYRNRGDNSTRRRVWIQGRFRKPLHGTNISSPGAGALLSIPENSQWDKYYKFRRKDERLSLPSNLVQMFPIEFESWRELLGVQKKKKGRKNLKLTEDNGRDYISSEPTTIIEVGSGLGNETLLNIAQKVKENEGLESRSVFPPLQHIEFMDISSEAIEKLKQDSRFSGTASYLRAKVCDLTSNDISPSSPANIIVLLYTLSAIGRYSRLEDDQEGADTSKTRVAVKNLVNMLHPGGIILFRDFGRHDDDQLRLNTIVGSRLSDNFYLKRVNEDSLEVPPTGTLCYFFDLEEVRDLFTSAGMEVLQLEKLSRVYKKKDGGAAERRRVWIHGRFRKPSAKK